jgi:hypothetical protein
MMKICGIWKVQGQSKIKVRATYKNRLKYLIEAVEAVCMESKAVEQKRIQKIAKILNDHTKHM